MILLIYNHRDHCWKGGAANLQWFTLLNLVRWSKVTEMAWPTSTTNPLFYSDANQQSMNGLEGTELAEMLISIPNQIPVHYPSLSYFHSKTSFKLGNKGVEMCIKFISMIKSYDTTVTPDCALAIMNSSIYCASFAYWMYMPMLCRDFHIV